MITMIGAELSFVAGIGGVILQLALLFIVFSLRAASENSRNTWTSVWMRSRPSSMRCLQKKTTQTHPSR